MASLIDWYLVELDNRLVSSLAQDERSRITAEVEDHLTASATESRNAGLSDTEADREAIRKFGGVGLIAWRMLEEKAPRNKQPLSRWPVWVAIACTVLCGASLLSGWYPVSLYFDTYGLPLFGTALFLVSVRTRRARPWAMFAVGTCGWIGMLLLLGGTWLNLYPVGGTGMTPIWFEKTELSSLAACKARDERVAGQLEEGLAYFKQEASKGSEILMSSGEVLFRTQPEVLYRGKQLPLPAWLKDGSEWRVPTASTAMWSGPYAYPLDGPIPAPFDRAATKDEATAIWLSRAPRATGELQSSIQRINDNLAAFARAHEVPYWQRLSGYFPDIAILSVIWTFGLMLINLIGVSLGELGRWLSVRGRSFGLRVFHG